VYIATVDLPCMDLQTHTRMRARHRCMHHACTRRLRSDLQLCAQEPHCRFGRLRSLRAYSTTSRAWLILLRLRATLRRRAAPPASTELGVAIRYTFGFLSLLPAVYALNGGRIHVHEYVLQLLASSI